MSMNEIDKIHKEYETIKDKATQSRIFYLLKVRVAAGQENFEEGSGKIEDPMGKVWTDATYNLDEMIKRGETQEVFDLALTTCLLPRDIDPKKEEIYRWYRADAPLILAKDELRDKLLDCLGSGPKALELAMKLKGYMNFDFSEITDKAKASAEADCFLAVATMYLGTKLGNTHGRMVEMLNDLAIEKLSDPQISKVVKMYSEIEDTAWLVEELKPFLVEKKKYIIPDNLKAPYEAYLQNLRDICKYNPYGYSEKKLANIRGMIQEFTDNPEIIVNCLQPSDVTYPVFTSEMIEIKEEEKEKKAEIINDKDEETKKLNENKETKKIKRKRKIKENLFKKMFLEELERKIGPDEMEILRRIDDEVKGLPRLRV